MLNTKILLPVTALAGTSLAQYGSATNAACRSSVASFAKITPTPSPELASYLKSVIGTPPLTAPGRTTALPAGTLEDPEGYQALICSVAENLPSSLLPAFGDYASELLSFGSAHESEYDAFITNCITTGEAAAKLTNAIHSMFTAGPGGGCPTTSAQYASTTNAECLSSLVSIGKEAPTPPPELNSYLESVIGTHPITAPGHTTALPPSSLEDPEGYQALLCSVAENLPSSLLPAFADHASQLLSFGSAHESDYDAYITNCITTGEAAAKLTSALHAMFTAGPGGGCPTTSSHSPSTTNAMCLASLAALAKTAPTRSAELNSYINSLTGTGPITLPGHTTALPPLTLEDPEGYEILYCSIAANLPSSLVPAFKEYASRLLSFGSVHESDYDAYITSCITTGSAAAKLTSALHSMFTASPGAGCPATSSSAAPGGSSYPATPVPTGSNSTAVPTATSTSLIPTAAAARPTGVVIGAAVIGGLLGAVALL